MNSLETIISSKAFHSKHSFPLCFAITFLYFRADNTRVAIHELRTVYTPALFYITCVYTPALPYVLHVYTPAFAIHGCYIVNVYTPAALPGATAALALALVAFSYGRGGEGHSQGSTHHRGGGGASPSQRSK